MEDWTWTTYRKLNVETETSGHPTIAMLQEVKQRISGFQDRPALLSLKLQTIVYERNAHEDSDDSKDIAYLVVDTGGPHGCLFTLAETLDEFAAKVGAPPRPKIEVPPAFLES